MAQRKIIKEVTDFVNQVKSCGISLNRVILFGSHARNTQTKDSDIDVALVSDEFKGVPAEDIKLFFVALRKHYMMQVLTYNTKDFFKAPDPFVKEILRTGIEIRI